MAIYRKLTVNATFNGPKSSVSRLLQGTLAGADCLGQYGYDQVQQPTDTTLLVIGRISANSIQRVRDQIEKNLKGEGATSVTFNEEPLEKVPT